MNKEKKSCLNLIKKDLNNYSIENLNILAKYYNLKYHSKHNLVHLLSLNIYKTFKYKNVNMENSLVNLPTYITEPLLTNIIGASYSNNFINTKLFLTLLLNRLLYNIDPEMFDIFQMQTLIKIFCELLIVSLLYFIFNFQKFNISKPDLKDFSNILIYLFYLHNIISIYTLINEKEPEKCSNFTNLISSGLYTNDNISASAMVYKIWDYTGLVDQDCLRLDKKKLFIKKVIDTTLNDKDILKKNYKYLLYLTQPLIKLIKNNVILNNKQKNELKSIKDDNRKIKNYIVNEYINLEQNNYKLKVNMKGNMKGNKKICEKQIKDLEKLKENYLKLLIC